MLTSSTSARRRARFVRELPGFSGSASLYHMDPPHDGHDHVVVSAAVIHFVGPETAVIPAREDGSVIDATRLLGSSVGTLAHADALSVAGYRME